MSDLAPGLENQTDLFRRIHNLNPSPLFITDLRKGELVYANTAFQEILNLDPVEGKTSMEQALHPEDHYRWTQHRTSCEDLTRDGQCTIELRLNTRLKGWQWFRVTEQISQQNSGGEILQLLGTLECTEDQRKLEERLREERRRFQNTQAIGSIGSFERELPGDLIFCSEEFCRIHGLEPGPMTISIKEFIGFAHPDEQEALKEAIDHTHATGKPLDLITRIVRRDGQVRHVHRRSAIIKKDGVPVLVYGTVQDITSRIESKNERKKLSNLLRSTEEVARTGSYEADLQRNEFYFSEGLYRLFGEEPGKEPPSLDWIEERSHPGDIERGRSIMETAAKNKEPFNYTRRIYRKDGEMRVLQIQGRAVSDDTEPSNKFIGLVQDITERQKAEEEIRQNERQSRRLLKVLQNVPDPYLILTSDLYIEVASKAYLKSTLSSAETIVGKHLFEAFPANPAAHEAKGVENLQLSLKKVLRTKKPDRMGIVQYDVPLQEGGFEEKFWSPVNTPVLDSEGNVEYIIHRVTDVTEVMKKTRDLKGLVNETEMLKTSLDEIRHQAKALKENKILLQSVFDASPNSIILYRILYDNNGEPNNFRVEIANTTSLNKVARNRKITGLTLSEAFPQIQETQVPDHLKRTAKTGERTDMEIWYEGEGLHHWFHIRATRTGEFLVVTIEDITERKNAEEDLLKLKDELAVRAADSEDRFQALVSASSDTIFKMNPDWTVMYTLIGKRFLADQNSPSSSWIEEYIPEWYRDRVLQAIQLAVESKSIFELEHPVFDKDRRISWTYSRAVPQLDKNGKILEWLGAASDITERKEAEERQAFFIKLNDILQKLDDPEEIQHQAVRLLGEHLGVHRAFYGELTQDEETMYVAPGYSRLLAPLPHVVQLPGFDSDTWDLLRKGKPLIFDDIRHELAEDSDLKKSMVAAHIRSSIWVPLVDQDRVSALISVQQSTSRHWSSKEINLVEETFKRTRGAMEKARIEKALRESEQRFRNLVESSAEAVWETDPAGLINSDSISWRKFTGQTYEEWVGTGWLEAVHPHDRQLAKNVWKQAIASGENIDVDFRVKNAQGQYRWTNVKATPIVSTDGFIVKWSGMNLDIHQQKMSEKALRKAKEDAEAASRAKEDFVSTMSHEIRTPLNAVIGFTNLLLEQQPRDDQKENLNSLSFSAQNLLSLINGILDFSKLEAGKMELEENEFDLHHLLFSLKKAHQPLARLRKNRILIHLDENTPRFVSTDQLKLSQVLHNLVGNAVKFTEEGTVDIYIDRKFRDGDLVLDFVIQDSGIGIPPDKLEHIFDKFSQAETSTARGYGGTGLGLSITRLLLGVMGSDIRVQSQPGEGSRFYFSLPVKEASSQPAKKSEILPQTDPEEIRNSQILLVEDVEINRNIVLQFLDNWWQVHPDCAVNGQEAIDMAEKKKYDLILMDVRMPVLDGYDATRRIRRIPGYQDTPILALTADKSGEVQLAVQSALFSDLLTKPFEPQELRQRILENLSGASEDASGDESRSKTRTSEDGGSGTDAAPFSTSRYAQMAGDHPEILKKLLENAFTAFQTYREEFAAAAQERDEQQLSELVHKNTTSIYYLQATALSEKIAEFRNILKDSDGQAGDLESKSEEVLTEFDRILSGLRNHL